MYSWVAVLALAGAASALDPLVALTKQGAVRGAPAAANVTEFLGIPFAAPPLRFADAAAAAPWNGTRASRPPAECAQASGGSEDCLYVNAYSTMVPGRPVMVYVHGGGFVSGAATRSAANLTRLTGSVVFAPQYRLGVLGFFGGDNRGLGDQLRALAWVRDNCAAFGGDPARVMVFGVSAGGASVAHLLVEPRAAGLFSAAALESPGGHQGWMAPGARPDDDFAAPAVVANASAAAAAALGCALDDVACLRAAPLAALLAAAKDARFAPSLARARPADDRSADGVETPLGLIRAGAWTRVPVIVGGQSCESCGAAEALFGPERDVSAGVPRP